MTTPDPSLHYVLGYSGGKDSTAAWLYLARELKLPRVTCTFADTGHESKVLHEYLGMLEREHGLPLVRVQPILADLAGELAPEKICERLGLDVNDLSWLNEPLTMERLAIIKRRFPSPTRRFCTTLLKLRPRARWLRNNCTLSECVSVTGIRAEESAARAKLPEHYEDKLFGCPGWRPLLRWTADEVFALHKKHGIPPNPFYTEGMSRVGCFPCIMARKPELHAIARRYPEALTELGEMETRVGQACDKPVMTFFSSNKTAKAYRSVIDQQSGKRICTADDVRRWAMGELAAGGLFPDEDFDGEEHLACESEYGLCE